MFEKAARILTVDKIVDWTGHNRTVVKKEEKIPEIMKDVLSTYEDTPVKMKFIPKKSVVIDDSKVDEILWII